jgi:hypothetical protein
MVVTAGDAQVAQSKPFSVLSVETIGEGPEIFFHRFRKSRYKGTTDNPGKGFFPFLDLRGKSFSDDRRR